MHEEHAHHCYSKHSLTKKQHEKTYAKRKEKINKFRLRRKYSTDPIEC